MTWHTYDALVLWGIRLTLLGLGISLYVAARRMEKALQKRAATIHHPASVGRYVHVRRSQPPYDWQLVGDAT